MTAFRTRRAVLGGLGTAGLVAAAAVALGNSSIGTEEHPLGLDTAVAGLIDSINSDGEYRQPNAVERSRAVLATARLLSGRDRDRTRELYAALGMALTIGTDTTTGRRCGLVTSETATARSWGLLVIERTGAMPHLLIEVPHPVADLDTARIGLALFRAIPGSALLIAGAHRDAAEGLADVAHQRGSLFQALAGLFAGRGATQLQLHGYANESLPEKDIVLSAGAAKPRRRIKRAAEGLTERGFEVCRAWNGNCDSLDGETNIQGRVAAEHGHPFVHVEMNRTTRADPGKRAEVIDVLGETYG